MAKVAVETQGCSANAAESEIMAGLLHKAGFALGKKEDADVIIINACTVKGESTALRAVQKAKEQYPTKKIVVGGCVTPKLLARVREIDEDACVLNTHNVHNIVSVVEESIHDTPITAFSKIPDIKVGLPRVQKNPVIGIIPILNSCAAHCTFCSTKLVKGKLVSYPKQAILAEARRMVGHGCRELWITSQDNGAYMLEYGTRELPSLLQELCQLPGDFTIRVGMMNPTHVIKMLPLLLEAYANPHIYQFLHIPIQSGNNRILSLMKRENTVEEYYACVTAFKKSFPWAAIATDIIVGFPTEAESEFNETIELIRKTMPDIVNISRFRQRHGTLAAYMDGQVQGEETKKRSRLATGICTNIGQLQNEQWLGWHGKIMITEKGKNGTWLGRNFAYKQVVVNGNFSLGEKMMVKIEKNTPWDLHGVVYD